MADATEWLVEYTDASGDTAYDHIATREDAVEYLRQIVSDGRIAVLYQRVPFTVQVDVTVKARRTRKQKDSPAPAEPSGGPPPSGSEPPSAGETIGATSPRAEEPAQRRTLAKAEPTAGTDPASSVTIIPTGKEEESPKEGAERRPAPSPVSVWDCEVDRYGEDGPCAGPIIFDEVTHGRFCEMHMVAAPSGRAEWHRRNGARNRPVARVA